MVIFRKLRRARGTGAPSRAKYAVGLLLAWLYTALWLWAVHWVVNTDSSVVIRLPVALLLIVSMPAIPDLFTGYNAYGKAIQRQRVPETRDSRALERTKSLSLLADTLEKLRESSPSEAEALVDNLPSGLHPDARRRLQRLALRRGLRHTTS